MKTITKPTIRVIILKQATYSFHHQNLNFNTSSIFYYFSDCSKNILLLYYFGVFKIELC